MKDETHPLAQMMLDITRGHATAMQNGMAAVEMHMAPSLRALEREYRNAQAENVLLPSALAITIEAVLMHLKPGANPYAERRKEPRPDPAHDMDCFGRHLKAGT